MKRVMARAIAYNAVGIVLAMFGLIHPVAAALLMVGSSMVAAWGAVRRPAAAAESDSEPRLLGWRTLAHACAVAAQGFVWGELLALRPAAHATTVIAFSAIGIVAAWLWRRSTAISHHTDMTFGMWTLGNLGMLLGWWMDHHFAPLPTCGCACTLESSLSKPGMWIGMLIACNLAMSYLSRRPHRSTWATTIGGNIGMIAGMAVGMGIAPSGIIGHFLGMSIGMMLGMALGHELGIELTHPNMVPASSSSSTRSVS
jgi:hypothetical protein